MRSIDYTQHHFSSEYYSTEDNIYDTEDTLGLSDSKVLLPRSAFVQSEDLFYGFGYLQKWTKAEIGVFVILIITIARTIFAIIKGKYIFSV